MAHERIAVIAAHPDDEVMFAGGAMALHARAGAVVNILIAATGATARAGRQGRYVAKLRSQAKKVADLLGARHVEFAGFPDNRMDTVPLLDVVQRIEAFLAAHGADRIYTHHGGDLNIDHRIVHHAVVTACRPLPGVRPLEILAGETNSATEWTTPDLPSFVPIDFLDIAPVLEAKIQALECYEGEIRAWPHPRSAAGVRALAAWRGAQSGFAAAEAFSLIRRTRHLP